MKVCNVLNMSGGKDSGATVMVAIGRQVENIYPVFADTGNEHDITYEYLNYLERVLDIKIHKVKANFSDRIESKRNLTVLKWRDKGVSEVVIKRAIEVLHPTGNAYLDLCLWKGRFPSARSQFCTEELKIQPITDQVIFPMLREFDFVESWQGVRKDESERRSKYVEREGIEPDATRVFAYRPILEWSAEDVFEFHRSKGIKWNPLYEMGMGRVGCMPCVNARKDEIKNIASRFPEVIDRIREWEELVSLASKRQSATFFCATNDPTVDAEKVDYKVDGIDRMVEWSKTSRGGRQQNLIATDAVACSSIYGLCE